MFRRRSEDQTSPVQTTPAERVTSVIGPGIVWKGNLTGSGGIRIEGAFEGNIALRGLLVVGETGRVTGETLRANVIIVAGAVRADIIAEKLEIRATGRVWGSVVTAAFATEEGAFLRGQVRMEDQVDIGLTAALAETETPAGAESPG
jgi:cytoskeletal protein CcmA (bactofilin family)